MRKLLLALGVLLFAFHAHAAPPTKVKIALIVESTVDDKGWCQAMHNAIQAVQARHPGLIEYAYGEKLKPAEAGAAARKYAADGWDIVIAHGAQYKNLVLELAAEFPKTTFAFGTSSELGPKNVFTYMPESEQTGYLNGLIAGLVTKTNVIGLVGPIDGGDAARYDRGFILGVKAVNPKAEVKVAHTGSFGDVAKAGELAHAQVNAGADVLTGSAQQAVGALRALATYKDRAVWWVGQDMAQLAMPEGPRVIAAASYFYAPVVEALVAKRLTGVLGGENLSLTFANGGLLYRLNDKVGPVLTPEARAKVEAAKKSLTEGKLPIEWQGVKL